MQKESELERRPCDDKNEVRVICFEDGGKELRGKEYEWFLQAGKGKERNSSLETSEGTSLTNNLILTQ